MILLNTHSLILQFYTTNTLETRMENIWLKLERLRFHYDNENEIIVCWRPHLDSFSLLL